jgi:hypothetical protein
VLSADPNAIRNATEAAKVPPISPAPHAPDATRDDQRAGPRGSALRAPRGRARRSRSTRDHLPRQGLAQGVAGKLDAGAAPGEPAPGAATLAERPAMPGPEPAASPGGEQPAPRAPALAKQAAVKDEPASALPELRPPGAPWHAPYAAEGGALPQAAVDIHAPCAPEAAAPPLPHAPPLSHTKPVSSYDRPMQAAAPPLPHAPPLSHTKPVSSYDRPMQYRGPMSPWTLPLSPSAGRSYARGLADSNSIGGVRPQLPSIPGLPSSVCVARLASVPNELCLHGPLCVKLVDRAMQCTMHTLCASSGGPQSCAAPVARLPIQVHL